MNTINAKCKSAYIADRFSNEIVSQLSSASLICDGIIAGLLAMESNLRGDRMSPRLMSALIWSLTRQLEEVNSTLELACRTDGGPR